MDTEFLDKKIKQVQEETKHGCYLEFLNNLLKHGIGIDSEIYKIYDTKVRVIESN